MPEPIRIGALGCSSVARRRSLPAIVASEALRLTAVASRDASKADAFATAFDCAPTDYAGLLARDDIDAVYLSLPTGRHVEWGRRVLAAGKHLLVEKPIATRAAGARELADLADRHGLVVRENFTFLHHAQQRTVAELIAGGRLGPVRSCSAEFCFPALPADDIRYRPDLGGGALLDAGVYPIRLAQLLFGDDQRVAGAALHHDPDTGVDVAGEALLVSGGGVSTSIRFGFQHSYGACYAIWGRDARLRVERAFTPPPSLAPRLELTEQDHAEQLTLRPDDQFRRCAESFASAIAAGDPAAERDRREASVRTLELVDGIRAAAVEY